MHDAGAVEQHGETRRDEGELDQQARVGFGIERLAQQVNGDEQGDDHEDRRRRTVEGAV